MRCGAFGDMVLLTTLLRRLHARLGQPVDIISSGSWTLPLLEGQPAVGEIFIIDTRKVFLCLTPRQRSLTRWLRARGAGPLTIAPILAMSRDEGTYILDVDASDGAMGAVLQQEQEGML